MRKIFLIISLLCSMFFISSCDAYSQAIVYNDTFAYEYSYNNHPVRYINGFPYCYVLIDNAWVWVLIDRMHYPLIIHHPNPRIYTRPYYNYHPRHYQRPLPHHYNIGHNPRINRPIPQIRNHGFSGQGRGNHQGRRH